MYLKNIDQVEPLFVIFKLIFGSDNQRSKELLLAFLNDVLNVPEGQSLVSVEMLNPIFNQQDITDKYAILDVKAKAVDMDM